MTWLWLSTAAAVADSVLDGLHLAGLRRLPADAYVYAGWVEGMEDLDQVMQWAALPIVAVGSVSTFLMLKWVYRVSRNANAVAEGLSIRPPWAVAWWFVPVANLWMPYRALAEAWKASCDPIGWQAERLPPIFRAWWLLSVGYALLTVVDVVQYLVASDVAGMMLSDATTLVTNGLWAATNLLLVPIVQRITDFQVRAMHLDVFT